jgi:hypothetical protein
MGCAPTLDQVARSTQAYGIKERCSQGPFEVHVPAFGSRWGEDVMLEARGDAVAGHSTLTIDGHVHGEETFGDAADVNNASCVLSDADRGATGATAPSTTSVGTHGGAGTTTTESVQASVQLLQAGIPNAWIHRTEIARYHNEVNDWRQTASTLKRGQDMKIVFWSEKPLDLHSTVFVLIHSEMVAPGNDDKKWQSHLDDVRSADDKAQAEAQAKANEEARCAALQTTDKKCHDEGIKTGSERVAYAAFQQKCEALAKDNATDQACRDDGWRNDSERPEEHPTTLQATAIKHEAPANRPPPAPMAETEPPKPSVNAEWIPGSWQWNGSDWAWLPGGWRVPEQDRAQKLTATAPNAPPASRVEARPTQPIASAVWADGYWHYGGGQWIWVPGHWAMPPRAGAMWRPTTWVQDGVQLRLDPGGWR